MEQLKNTLDFTALKKDLENFRESLIGENFANIQAEIDIKSHFLKNVVENARQRLNDEYHAIVNVLAAQKRAANGEINNQYILLQAEIKRIKMHYAELNKEKHILMRNAAECPLKNAENGQTETSSLS